MADEKKEPPKPASPHGKPAAAAGPTTGGAPSAAKAELARRAADRNGDEGKKKNELPPAERAMQRLGRALILLAVVILLSVIVGAALLYGQLTLMRGQLGQMQAASHQNDQALATAARVAEAAKKSADSIPDMQRAYLLVDAAGTVLPKTLAANAPARIGFKNYGKTPATLRGVAGRYYYSAGTPGRISLPQSALPVTSAVADGGAVGPYDIALDASDEEIARAQKGDGTMVVQALIGYVDLFGEAHETGICFGFDAKAGAFAACSDPQLNYHN